MGKRITPDHREKMIEEASSARVVKRIQHKLNLVSRPFCFLVNNYHSNSLSLTSLFVCDWACQYTYICPIIVSH